MAVGACAPARPLGHAQRRAARGVGLTPRLFEALVGAPDAAAIEALPATYVPAIGRHVQSVTPSKQVMAQYWCPVVVEDESGARHVLHVDPLAVRRFRRAVAEELRLVQAKRRRMLRRIQNIRQELPKACANDTAARLGREIADAEGRADEPLLRLLPEVTKAMRSLHVLIEATPCMVQLGLVCKHLLQELPAAIEAAGTQLISLTALGSGGSGCRSSPGGGDGAPVLPPDLLDCTDLPAVEEWLRDLGAAAAAPARRSAVAGFRLAGALRRATTADALQALEGGSTVVLVASSQPSDLEASVGLLRRSDVVLQVAGVLGASAEDPEPTLQRLVDAAAPGSSLHLFFGRDYWSKFAAARRRQLDRLRETADRDRAAADGDEDGEVISPKILELRCIERIMRECYAEEQLCEEELGCAGRVLKRTLVDREDILAALREPAGEASLALSSLGRR